MTQDFFGTASFAIVANETYARGVRNFLEEEMGLPCTFSFARRAGVEAGQRGGARRQSARRRRLSCSAATTSACTSRRSARARPIFPASFPGAIIRRHTGTPFMGYSGATYIVQEVCNALFDALFNILPLASTLDQVEATPSRLHSELPWDEDAKAVLDEIGRGATGSRADFGGQAPARRRRTRGADVPASTEVTPHVFRRRTTALMQGRAA